MKFRNCISRKQAVFAFLDFVYPWFTDQINYVNYVKYFSWFCASLLSLTSGKNGHTFSSFWELTSSRTKMTLLKSFKTSSLGANHKCLSLLTWPQKVLPLTHTNWILSTEIIFWLIKLWLRKWLRELTSKIDFLSMQWYGLLQKTEFKEWLGTMPAFNVNPHIIQWFLCFNLSMQEKGVPEIQKFSSVQFSYEWFGLGFTGVGLPSLARRARVPADSATLISTNP